MKRYATLSLARARGEQMAKKRGRQSRFRDVACPNARCKFYGKPGSGTVVSSGTYFVGGMRVRRGQPTKSPLSVLRGTGQ